MQPDPLLDDRPAGETACMRFLEFYACQSQESRAAILGFLHLVGDADPVRVSLEVVETGQIALRMEAATTIDD